MCHPEPVAPNQSINWEVPDLIRGGSVAATYILSDGVSGHGGVGDLVLLDGTLGVVPTNGQAAGGGVKHAHVPGSGARNWAEKKQTRAST